MNVLIIILCWIIIVVCIFVMYLFIKHIHFIMVQKEVKKIFNNSKNDEQFLEIMYNTFKL
jgi:flagellar basal body-associated protein FliL